MSVVASGNAGDGAVYNHKCDKGEAMIIHRLKTLPEYWNAVNDGLADFTVRKNDRGYAVGDVVKLLKYDSKYGYLNFKNTAVYEDEAALIVKRIKYILPGGQWGIKAGYVVLGLEEVE